jgi:hypothetical protein
MQFPDFRRQGFKEARMDGCELSRIAAIELYAENIVC